MTDQNRDPFHHPISLAPVTRTDVDLIFGDPQPSPAVQAEPAAVRVAVARRIAVARIERAEALPAGSDERSEAIDAAHSAVVELDAARAAYAALVKEEDR